MQEEWRDIVIEKNGITYDYTGLYQISNLGRVKSLEKRGTNGVLYKEKLIYIRTDKHGYQNVYLHKNGHKTTFKVHRLVATAFIPNTKNLPVVNHKDECKTNNVWTNLEWCTMQYNTQYSARPCSDETKAKLSNRLQGRVFTDEHRKKISDSKSKKIICLETSQVFDSLKKAQEWVPKGNISHCLKGESKTAGGYHWMYYEDWLKLQKNKREDDIL